MPIPTAEVIRWLMSHGLRIVVILAATLVIRAALHAVIHRMELIVEDEDKTRLSEAEKRARTLGRILRSTSTALLFFIAAMMILRELGMDIGPLIAGAGVAGLAVGFGAQSLVKDVLTGFFLLLEDQVRVGDVVKAAGVSGIVEYMNLRTVILRDLEGRVHVIPNGQITVVTNMTKEWSRYVIDVGVAYKENVDVVMAALREIGEGLCADPQFGPLILGPLEILGVDDFKESEVTIRIMIKTMALEQWKVGRELRRRIKNGFDERGIEIPFPHRTLFLKEVPAGTPPAAAGGRDRIPS